MCPKDLGPVYSQARMPASFCLAPDPSSLSMMPGHRSLDLKGQAKIKEEEDAKHLRGEVNKMDGYL